VREFDTYIRANTDRWADILLYQPVKRTIPWRLRSIRAVRFVDDRRTP